MEEPSHADAGAGRIARCASELVRIDHFLTAAALALALVAIGNFIF
jgi:hypothetical protein